MVAQVEKIVGSGAPDELLQQIRSIADSHCVHMDVDCIRWVVQGVPSRMQPQASANHSMLPSASHELSFNAACALLHCQCVWSVVILPPTLARHGCRAYHFGSRFIVEAEVGLPATIP